jgi:hypothetical protein
MYSKQCIHTIQTGNIHIWNQKLSDIGADILLVGVHSV